jgi:hypothetical protein
MGPYLARTQGIRLDDLNDLSKTVGFMLGSDYILPAQRAAPYRSWPGRPGSPSNDALVRTAVADRAGELP